MMEQSTSTKVKTPEFQCSFPHVLTPHSFEDQAAEYSVTALFDKGADLRPLKRAIKAAIKKKWPNKEPKNLRLPEFRDGDEITTREGDPREECQGKTVVRFKSKTRRPLVINRTREPITDESEIYGGCYGYAIVEAYAWENNFGRGVSFGLLGFQKSRDGEPFVGGVSADEFEDIEEEDLDEYEDDL